MDLPGLGCSSAETIALKQPVIDYCLAMWVEHERVIQGNTITLKVPVALGSSMLRTVVV